jgi:peptidoglycan/LPS O-acetylase OafA/YrhL
MKNNTYYPQLNALRGIGVMSVFIYHSYKPNFGNGAVMSFAKFCYQSIYLSMDMFFALSAFIITHLALNEIKKTQGFSFRNFILRRVLRIWPIYFLILLFTYLVLAFVAQKNNIPITLPPACWYFLFVSNFYLPEHVFFLRQLWTISVEEQFYIVWGLLVLFFKTKLKPAMFTLAAISVAFSTYYALKNINVYYHTLSYFFDMMSGAFFAYLIYKKSKVINFIASESKGKTLCLYLFLPIFFIIYFLLDKCIDGIANDILDVVMRMIFIIHHSMIFVDQMHNVHSFFNLSRHKFLIFIGKIAYGVYCFHGIVLTFGFFLLTKYNITIHPILSSVVMFCITIAIGSLSYRFIEKPIIDLKYKLRIS